jgi:hypothetical protein
MAQYSGNLINTDIAQNYNRAEHEHSNYGTRRLQFFQIEILGYDVVAEPNWSNDDPNSIDHYTTGYTSDFGEKSTEFLESRKSIVYPVLRGVAQVGEIMYNGEFEIGSGQYSGNTYVIVALSADTMSTTNAQGFDAMRSKSLATAIEESIANFEYGSVNVFPIWHVGNSLTSSEPAVQSLTVIVIGNGTGTVTSSPAGITAHVGNTVVYEYEQDTTVTLTAAPAIGSAFSGWAGSASGTGAAAITMTGARTVVATFTDIS